MDPLFTREELTAVNGMPLTMGLFYEYRHQGEATPVYCLKETDWKGCLSMYRIYMAAESEYEAAQQLLGSWGHWNKLCACAWFKPHLEAWREEREIKEAALGKAVLIQAAEEGNVTAAKELVAQIKNIKKGRPSKKDAQEQQRKNNAVDDKVISILNRMEYV